MLHDPRQDVSIGPKHKSQKNSLLPTFVLGTELFSFVLTNTRTFIRRQYGNLWAVKQILKLQTLQITAESVIAFCITRQERNTDKNGV